MIFKYELPSTELIVVEKNNCLKFGEYLNDMQCDDTENKLFINDLEYVKRLKIQISAREEEYKKLEDNWNKLKEYIDKTKFKEFEKSYGKRYGKTFIQAEVIVCNMILNKMQELQGSNSNE